MSPLFDFMCDGKDGCGYVFEQSVSHDQTTAECRCSRRANRLPALIGGYIGNLGTSSTRPKKTASNTGTKVFTGERTPEEPEQLEFDYDRGIK